MTIEKIIELIKSKATNFQKEFSAKLTPTNDIIYGVKVPILREMAKDLAKEDCSEFFASHKNSMEEKMLFGFIIGNLKTDYETFNKLIDEFVPCIDNWAVCDTVVSSLKQIKKYETQFLIKIKNNIYSNNEFVCRFYLICLLDYYIKDDYVDYIFEVSKSIKTDKYYVNMAIAWLLSVCFVKFRDKTLEFLSNKNLNDFTYNKTLQKIVESNRVSNNDKIMIKAMRLKI